MISSKLDATYHPTIASKFAELGIYLRRMQASGIGGGHRDLAAFLVAGFPKPFATAATEPVEKTHIFFLLWGDSQNERRWKDGDK